MALKLKVALAAACGGLEGKRKREDKTVAPDLEPQVVTSESTLS